MSERFLENIVRESLLNRDLARAKVGLAERSTKVAQLEVSRRRRTTFCGETLERWRLLARVSVSRVSASELELGGAPTDDEVHDIQDPFLRLLIHEGTNLRQVLEQNSLRNAIVEIRLHYRSKSSKPVRILYGIQHGVPTIVGHGFTSDQES